MPCANPLDLLSLARTFGAMWSVELSGPERTFELGRALGRVAEPGVVVALVGELGAGKTLFAQGVGAALEVEGQVLSPTFVLVSEHPGRLPLLHADLYRLGPGEVEGLGLEEALERWPGVALVEWPERAPEVLPPDHLELRLSRLGEGRLAELHPHGPRSEALLSRLEQRW